MVNETQNKPIEWIQKLQQYRSKEKQDELAKILDYWEKIKAEWERKKQEFWEIHDREDFLKLLRYKWKHENELLWKYQYWESMKWLEREKYIAEYLHDDMLYSIDIQKYPEKKVWRKYSYEDWKNWNVVIEEWVELHLYNNQICPEWAEAIAKYLKLKEWVYLYFYNNQIRPEWAEAIAKYLKLKEWVKLYLYNNQIWDVWAKAIAKYLELKEWVELYLSENQIWDVWAEAIMGNMELKNWVTLDLIQNNITDNMKQKLKDWEKSYQDKWINCKVLV